MNTTNTVNFMDLMNSQLKYISLATILDYHERFLEAAEKETTPERKKTCKMLVESGVRDSLMQRPFIGLFQ